MTNTTIAPILDTVDGILVASFADQPRCPSVDLLNVFDDLFHHVKSVAKCSLVLDLSDIAYFDSSSLGELARLKQKIEKDGGQIALCCLSDTFDELLKVIGMHRLFSIFDDRQSALNSLQNEADGGM